MYLNFPLLFAIPSIAFTMEGGRGRDTRSVRPRAILSSIAFTPKSLSCLVKSRKAAGVNTNGIPRRDPLPPSLFQASAFKWRAFVISSLRASSPSRGHFSVEPLESGSTPLFHALRTNYQSITTEGASFLGVLNFRIRKF